MRTPPATSSGTVKVRYQTVATPEVRSKETTMTKRHSPLGVRSWTRKPTSAPSMATTIAVQTMWMTPRRIEDGARAISSLMKTVQSVHLGPGTGSQAIQVGCRVTELRPSTKIRSPLSTFSPMARRASSSRSLATSKMVRCWRTYSSSGSAR